MAHHMSKRAGLGLGAAVGLLLAAAACSGDDDSMGPGPPDSTFNTFVLNEFARTADDIDPAPINGLEFSFNEDATAFDSLLD